MKKIYIFSILLLTFLSTKTSSADTAADANKYTILNPIGINSIPEFIMKIMDVIIQIGLIFIVLAIIYAGLQFILAQGNPEKISKAKMVFLYTIIGGVVLLGSQAMSIVLCNTASQFNPGLDCSFSSSGSGGSGQSGNNQAGSGQSGNTPIKNATSSSQLAAASGEVQQIRNCINQFSKSGHLSKISDGFFVAYVNEDAFNTDARPAVIDFGDDQGIIETYVYKDNSASPNISSSNTSSRTTNTTSSETTNVTPAENTTRTNSNSGTFSTYTPSTYYNNPSGGLSGPTPTTKFSTPQAERSISDDIGQYDSVTVSAFSYETGQIESLDVKGLWSDPNYAKDPKPIDIDGYVTGITLTRAGINGSADFGASSGYYDESRNVFVKNVNGYDTSDGTYLITDEVFCFCPPEESFHNGELDLANLTGGAINSNELIRQRPMYEVDSYDFSKASGWLGIGENKFEKARNEIALDDPDREYKLKNIDNDEVRATKIRNIENIENYPVLSNNKNILTEDNGIYKDKLSNYIDGAKDAECMFGLEPCTAVRSVVIMDTEKMSNGVSISGLAFPNGDIVVSSSLLKENSDLNINYVGRHEAFHAVDLRNGLSDLYTQKDIYSNSTDPSETSYKHVINERNSLELGNGGHSQDNNLELFATTMNTVDAPKWQENVVDKMNTSEKQNYKQSLEIWSEVLEEKGFNNTPAADNVRNAIDVLDGELNSSNGQTLNNLNNNLDSILSMFFRKRYN